jgi:hypothetical protein
MIIADEATAERTFEEEATGMRQEATVNPKNNPMGQYLHGQFSKVPDYWVTSFTIAYCLLPCIFIL